MPRVVHFEFTSDDPEKSAAFFQKVFGWKVTKWDGPQEYWLVETGEEGEPGINGGLFRPSGIFSGTVNTIAVPDIDAYIESVYEAALFDAFQASMAKLYSDGYISFEVFLYHALKRLI